MTNEQELSLVWRQLAQTYVDHYTASSAEKKRLLCLQEMLRKEYRMLTSTFQ